MLPPCKTGPVPSRLRAGGKSSLVPCRTVHRFPRTYNKPCDDDPAPPRGVCSVLEPGPTGPSWRDGRTPAHPLPPRRDKPRGCPDTPRPSFPRLNPATRVPGTGLREQTDGSGGRRLTNRPTRRRAGRGRDGRGACRGAAGPAPAKRPRHLHDTTRPSAHGRRQHVSSWEVCGASRRPRPRLSSGDNKPLSSTGPTFPGGSFRGGHWTVQAGRWLMGDSGAALGSGWPTPWSMCLPAVSTGLPVPRVSAPDVTPRRASRVPEDSTDTGRSLAVPRTRVEA